MRYRLIDVRIWGDGKFRALSPIVPSGQALFMYLLTNPNTTSIPGLYRAGAAAMAEELNWDLSEFKLCFDEIVSHGLVFGDFSARVIFIPNAIKYNKPASPNVVKSWRSAFDEIPECNLKNLAFKVLQEFVKGMGEAFHEAFQETFNKPLGKSTGNPMIKALPKPLRMTMSNQEQDHEQEQDQEVICEADAFSAPDIKGAASTITPAADVIEVFRRWQEVLLHPRAVLDKKRHEKIAESLENGYTVEELKQAIDGCALTPFNMGANDRGQRYDSIHVIFRDSDQIERFIENSKNPPLRQKIANTPADWTEGAL